MDVAVLSMLIDETDANLVNEVMQLLANFEAKIKEAQEPTTSREFLLWWVANE